MYVKKKIAEMIGGHFDTNYATHFDVLFADYVVLITELAARMRKKDVALSAAKASVSLSAVLFFR